MIVKESALMTSTDSLKQDISAIARELSQDISEKYTQFTLHYVLFRRGEFGDESEKILAGLKGHPCESSAGNLLRRSQISDQSAFLGIATGAERGIFGLKKKSQFMGFAALNIDFFTRKEDAAFELYHLTAQAIDTYQLIQAKQLNIKDKDIVLLPKRNQLALARSNLRSDIFSALMMQQRGTKTAVQDLAVSRGKRSLIPQTLYRPEDYPFAISKDVMEYSVKNILSNKREDSLFSLFNLSGKIATSFDKHNLKSWIDFAAPAQTLAWNGFSQEQILGTAIYTSPDPFVKATGNLICEITNIVPDRDSPNLTFANPYLDDSVNKINHARLTEETFELAIMRAVETESHLPLISIANDQNEELLKGRVLGWCADALQSAAKTFESTLKKGLPPAPASRIEFQRLAANSNWDNLDGLNSYMVTQRRNGHAMTFSDISDWCAKRPELKPVLESIQMTMADPIYAQKLAMANEVPMPGPRIATPAAAPQPQMAPGFAPNLGMGGMMGSGGIVHPPRQPPAFTDETEE